MPSPCSSARNARRALQRVAHPGALERPQLAAEDRLDLERRRVVGARAADVLDRGVVLGAQALEHVGGLRRDLDPERAQVVLERLEQVGVDRQRAAVGLARGQREEGGDHLGVPVDLELEARLADALDQRQRRRRRLEPDQQALRAAQRALVQARARARPRARRRPRPERQPEAAAALSARSPSSSSQLAGDRLEHEPPRPAAPALTRPTQPRCLRQPALTSGATFSHAWRSSTPLT